MLYNGRSSFKVAYSFRRASLSFAPDTVRCWPLLSRADRNPQVLLFRATVELHYQSQTAQPPRRISGPHPQLLLHPVHNRTPTAHLHFSLSGRFFPPIPSSRSESECPSIFPGFDQTRPLPSPVSAYLSLTSFLCPDRFSCLLSP